MTNMITTRVDPIVCLRDGHVTFLSSTLTSRRNWTDFVKTLSFCRTAGVFEPTNPFFATAGADLPPEAKPFLPWESTPSPEILCFFFRVVVGVFFLCKRPILLLKYIKAQG